MSARLFVYRPDKAQFYNFWANVDRNTDRDRQTILTSDANHQPALPVKLRTPCNASNSPEALSRSPLMVKILSVIHAPVRFILKIAVSSQNTRQCISGFRNKSRQGYNHPISKFFQTHITPAYLSGRTHLCRWLRPFLCL